MSQYVTSHRRAAMSADVCDCNRSTAGSCWRHPRSFSMPLTDEREAAAATPSLDTRCPQTAGRCEKDAGHEGDHYTEYKEPVWSWMVGAATPSLDRDAIAAQKYGDPGPNTGECCYGNYDDAHNHGYEHGWNDALESILARLDEGSATPEAVCGYFDAVNPRSCRLAAGHYPETPHD